MSLTPYCAELNECFFGLDDCDDNAECTNTPGSFQCVCNTGYQGDGVLCTGEPHK